MSSAVCAECSPGCDVRTIKRGALEVTRSEEQILRDLEELRQKLKIKAGVRYDPEKIQEASETSELFDQVLLEYLSLQADKKRR